MTRSVSFTISGAVDTRLTITELDGDLLFQVEVVSDTIGDLRALFFDLEGFEADGGLSVVDGADVTDSAADEGGVSTLGRDANIKGEVVNELGAFDVGVEFGTSGASRDDIQATSFRLTHDATDLTLDMVNLADFGIRYTSVGEEDGRRKDSAKIGGEGGAVASNDALSALEAEADAAALLANDVDSENRVLIDVFDDAGAFDFDGAVWTRVLIDDGREIGIVTVDAAGAATLSATGADVALLDEGELLEATFTYVSADVQGAEASAIVAVTVTGVANLDPLFTPQNDDVDFATVVAGTYLDGTQYAALGGDDRVVLADDLAAAAAAGYDPALVFDAGSGADTVIGGGLSDTVDGGGGDDSLDGGAGGDVLIGNGGADAIFGGLGDDTLIGGADDDLVEGGDGDDQIDGRDGDDLLCGDDGNDVLSGGAGADTLRGGEGADTMDGNLGGDLLLGEGGNDSIRGGGDDDEIFGGAGDDVVDASAGADTVDGGDGDDFLFGNDGADLITGGRGADTLSGGGDNDTLDGGDGDDRLEGRDGDDLITGGNGNDFVSGDGGADVIDAGDGADTCDGNEGDDLISGGGGNDSLRGGGGNDTIFGGAGDDTCDASTGDDVVDCGDGADTVFGNDGNDLLDGGAGDDTVLGGRDDDTLIGGAGSDSLQGGVGDDELRGGVGDDTVIGNDGVDHVIHNVTESAGDSDLYSGGRGLDVLTLELDRAQWFDPAIQADIAAYRDFLDANTDPVSGEGNNNIFQFTAFDLRAFAFEELCLIVDDDRLTTEDDPVVAVDDAVTISEDGLARTFDTVLVNDVAPDLAARVELVSGPAAGALDFITGSTGAPDGRFSFNPAGAFDDIAEGDSREVSFVYRLFDADGDSDTATVTITVEGVNDAPVANDDVADTDTRTPIVITAADLLANDTDVDLRAGEALSLVAVDASGLSGALTDNGDGTFTYDPTGAFDGTGPEGAEDAFTYTISDPQGAEATATVTIRIEGAAPPTQNTQFGPVFVFINQTLDFSFGQDTFVDDDEGGAITYSATLPDGDPLPDWLSFDPLTRTFSGTPEDQDVSAFLVRITATEDDGQTAFQDVPFTVLDGNIIDGTAGPDSLTGTVDGDLVRGFDGADTLSGSIGIDLLDGGSGNDLLTGGDGGDVLFGGVDNDVLNGGVDDDFLFGGEGNDRLTGDGGADFLFGGDGADLLIGSAGADTVFGGEGDDQIRIAGGDVVFGEAGNDLLTLTTSDTAVIDAGADDDLVVVRISNGNRDVPVTLGGGVDVVRPDYSNGIVTATRVIDVADFQAGPGGDRLDLTPLLAGLNAWDGASNPFPDLIRVVQNGVDTFVEVDVDLSGAFETHIILRGVDASALTLDNVEPPYNPQGGATPGVEIIGAPANETLTGGLGDDTIDGQGGLDSLVGGSGGDLLIGGNDADTLDGGFGGDELRGGGGDDSLRGGEGADTIIGGAGNDRVAPSDGADVIDTGDDDDRVTLGRELQSADVISTGEGADRVEFPNNTRLGGDIVDLGGGDDVVEMGATFLTGPAILTLGDGADTVVFTRQERNGEVTITDFRVGPEGDKLSMILAGAFENYDGAANLFATGHWRLTQDGGDTLFEFDFDGPGAGDADYVLLARLQNVDATTLTAETFDPGFDPGGAPAVGQTLVGTEGADEISGGAGGDLITTGGGSDRVNGGFGRDTIDGGAGNNRLEGGAGDDVITGSGRLDGGFHDDTLIGGADDDTLIGGTGDDSLVGGDGNDSLRAGGGADTLEGGAGDDTLQGVFGVGEVYGGADADVITGGRIVDAGAGDDQVTARRDGAVITLGEGADLLTLSGPGGPFSTVTDFLAGAGNDVVDFIGVVGGDGVSNPFGAGRARLVEDGDDVVLELGANANYAAAIVFENTTIETFAAANFAPGLPLDGSGVSGQSVTGTNGSDTIDGGFGDDALSGAEGDDVLSGGNGADTLTGGVGDDDLSGGFGFDTLEGGEGADRLTGGDRPDALTGGAGADVFVYLRVEDGGDAIADFETGLDRFEIDLSGFDLSSAPLVLIDQTATEEDAVFIFDSATGRLSFDEDGAGAAEAQLIATLTNGATIDASDFDFI